uniref:protein-serine/threonine phosphatase n=1 Tax=Meloidogyne incognita TaxID=6306 RepID=A0A914MXU7_MELIC
MRTKIAELLDPNKIYFDYRVLSRDELLSSIHKAGNLKALFPCSEQLVLMLDDRPDVWMHSDALIRLKPYRFFLDVGDINYPLEKENKDSEENKKNINDKIVEKKEMEKKEKEEKGEESLNQKGLFIKVKEFPQILSTYVLYLQKSEESGENKKLDEERTKKSELKIDLPDELSKPVTPLSDNDNALVYIERILKEIHSIFYEQYDREGQTPNVKHIVSWLRSQVLKGERIVFSGIVPLGIDINSCEIYQLCTQFGAKVGEKIVKGETTVLVAAKAGTEKIRQAKRLRIPVVSVRWLEACYERWQKLDKRDFLFCEEDCAEFGGSLHSKKPRLSETLCSSTEMDHFSQMDTLDKKALQEMENEVDCALSEDDDDDNEASTSFYTQLKTEKEDQELSVSDNDNNNSKFVDDILPNLNEEEDPQEYSKCLDESEIPLNDEEEDEQDYIDYENEHLGEKESSSDGENEVKQYGKEGTFNNDDEEVGGQFEKEASYGENDVRQFGDSDTNDLNEDYDEMVADIEQQLNDNK